MSDESVERTLGKLLANVEALSEKFDSFEEKSDESRAGMHERMDKIIDRVGALETANAVITSDIETVKKDISDIKPVTDDVKRWRLMGMGALGVTGIAFAALGVSFSDAIKRIIAALAGHG